MSFANAFRRTTNPQSTTPTIATTTTRRTTSLLGQAFQATVGQLQQQTALHVNQLSSNHQQTFDGSIKYRCFFDIKEENTDSRGNVSLTSVPR